MSGTITISLEIELAWGLHHLSGRSDYNRLSKDRRRETATLDRLLDLCDELEIPISFDIVGHLLLESCSGTHQSPHPDDWFDKDPGGDRDTEPLFYAPDLVQRIQRARVDHEICTHTFSHVLCEEVSPEIVDWELETVADLHAEHGLGPPTSFVPPVHSPPPKDVLARHGIRTVRTPVRYEPPVQTPEPPDDVLGKFFWRIRRSHPAQVLFRSHPVRDPRVVNGVVETYTTWHASLSAPYLPNGRQPPHVAYRVIPTPIRQSIHERYLVDGLDRAMERDSYAHFWTHLFNLSNDTQWPPVRSFLQTLAERRERSNLNIVTMDILGDRFL